MPPKMDPSAFSRPRKRAYPDESATSLAATNIETDDLQETLHNEQNGIGLRRKRSRTNEWPLKNVIDSGNMSRTSPQGTRGKRKASHGQPGKRSIRKRISKFQEGSLNDKPSKQPPASFIGAEDAMEKYHNDNQPDSQDHMSYSAGIEESRPSSTFGFGRFGKAVANVFSGFWKEKESIDSSPSLAEMNDRKQKAEDAYAILKAQGFKGTKPLPDQHGRHSSLNERRVAAYLDEKPSIQDSGLDIDKSQLLSPPRLHPFMPNERLQPPSNAASKRSISPGSAITTGGRSSSLHFRTPSFQSLKKVKSHVHIPSITRSTDTLPDHVHQEPKTVEFGAHGLSRQPSKRDLAKHEKLTKKVSNLESKLDAARRDLEKSLKDAPPVPDMPASRARKPFTPGGLSSLPSERLLTPQTMPGQIAQSNTEIYGSIVVSREPHLLSSPSRQLHNELKTSCNAPPTNSFEAIDASMSSDPLSKPEIQGIDHACLVAAQAAKTRRNSSFQPSTHRSSREAKESSSGKKPQRSAVPAAPENSPLQSTEAPPPLPKLPIAADEIDRPRPDSPFLGRPATASPMKTRSRTHKRKPSPSPNASTSASKKKKAHFSIYDDELDMPLTPDNAAGNRQKVRVAKDSPAPKAVQIKAARAKAVKVSLEKGRVEKPLPKIRTEEEEEFQWDEDVF